MQCGSEVDRVLAHHILALERAHNEREDPAEPVDSVRCECGHLSADHHTPKFAGMNNVVKFGCIQCGCSDFRSPESILPGTTSLLETYWTSGAGGWRNRRQGYALCQQATIEAVCRWLECGSESKFYGRLCEILRTDADRVVRKAREEE